MDPHKPESFCHRVEKLSTGRLYHFVDQLPKNYDPKRHHTLLCVHGFPDLWYGWRFQIGPWVRRGYRVVAPDMLGYGGTSKPIDALHYTTKSLCADLAALLDLLQINKAVLVGHDWGAYVAGRFALWYPERLHALVMLSVPYTPPSPQYIPIEEVARRAPNLGYQVYLSTPKSSLEVLAYLQKFLKIMFISPQSPIRINFLKLGELEKLLIGKKALPNIQYILTEKEMKFYESQLSKGMFGPLNYYRTSKFRHDEESEYGLPASLRPDLPVLFLYGTKDGTCPKFVISKSKKFIPRYQDVAFEGRGHWLMVEARDEVTKTIVEWLDGLTSNKVKVKL